MLYPVLQDPLHPIVSSLFDRPRGASIGQMLFGAGEQGGWYDVSDMSTLFQDAAGTTPVTAVEQPVGRMLDKSGRGNHATQATTTKRPVLSRRVNLLTKTEDFQNVAWITPPTGTVKSNNAGTDPLGGGTAGKVECTQAGSTPYVANSVASGLIAGATYRSTCYVRTGVGVTSIVFYNGKFGAYKSATINLITGAVTNSNYTTTPVVSVSGDGFVSISADIVAPDTTGNYCYVQSAGGNAVGDHFFIWHPSLTLATDAHLPYQRVNTATDYDADPSKFPTFERYDGIDDSASSPTGGGGTAGFFYSSAITVAGGAGTARTLFSDAGTNTGYIVRINSSNQLELAAGNGTAYTTVASAAALTAPTSAVVQAWDDGVNLNVRIGSGPVASVARPAVSAGTAGFTIGQDNGASSGHANVREYSTIYRKDSAPTLAQRDAVAAYQRLQARFA